MILWVLAYLGGLLTILSPCILPVLPFVFSRSEEPFRKSTLPLLIGMAFTFALFASLAAVGGGWVIHANQWGRWMALGLLTLFAFTLLFPSFGEHINSPFTKLGGKLTNKVGQEKSFGKSFILGIATGLLWAPCAGPILGLILSSAALKGASVSTTFLLLAYALGAATSLALAILAGGRIFQMMKKYLGADKMVRKILGVAVLLGVAASALGLDRGLLTKLSKVNTERVEQKLIGAVMPETKSATDKVAPELPAVSWLNSKPLTMTELRGKVVLIDFWTYSCINCLRSLPYVKAWAKKYQDQGLVVIGVHTPEFAFEKIISNVETALKDLDVTYPVAIDNEYAIWNSYNNRYWPAHYFIDKEGKIRHHHFGEGEYEKSEAVIRKLLGLPLMEISQNVSKSYGGEVLSPETYIGSARAKNQVLDPLSKSLKLNQWGLVGKWSIQNQSAILLRPGGKIIYRFHARDLHLVLGKAKAKPVSFRVILDGKIPGLDHGLDVNEKGEGVVDGHRLYQLIRQTGPKIEDHQFEIEFDAPVEAFAFTFG